MKTEKLFFMECHLAGRQYHDANEVWEELHIGTKLELEREPDNRFDQNAIQVVYYNVDDEGNSTPHLLGYIPSSANETIARIMDMGWNDIFECRISRISPEEHYENQIRLTLRIRRNENANKD